MTVTMAAALNTALHDAMRDDDTRYRSAVEIDAWRARDPLERFLALLRESDMVDDAFLATVDAEGETIAARMRDALFGAPDGDPREMFDHVYAAKTSQLQAQQTALDRELSATEETE